jgi:hypothetical protein
MMQLNGSLSLVRAKLARLRPTQFSVGYIEVERKAKQWADMKHKKLEAELEQHVFPAVLGLSRDYYVIDHHHLGVALLERGVKEVWVTVLDDLSWLDARAFWRTLEFRGWAYPYDQKGRRRTYGEMPKRLLQLKNDPYRGLAGLVQEAGGFAKVPEPFAQFLWADFFRPRIVARLIKASPRRAIPLGVKLARSPQARYLPGWTGSL